MRTAIPKGFEVPPHMGLPRSRAPVEQDMRRRQLTDS